jgi:hypothetical protein
MRKTEFTITPESQAEAVAQQRISEGWSCEYRSYVGYKSGYEANILQVWSKLVRSA